MTTKTALRKARTTGKVYGLKAVGDPADGVFEAYVSIFGNVDFHNERIRAGAFASSLERWKASGDPIPVIFSHQWDELDAHIGEVLEAEEHLPGDDRLPMEIRANGGLWTKFALELDEDFAARVAKKLTKRTIREFSFAYDVLDEDRATDGVNELVELDVLEVGPTLKGANPATVLLSKALGDDVEGMTEDEVLDRLAKALKARGEKAGEKSSVPVTFEGSIETELDAVYAAAYAWASGGNIGNGGFYALHQEATFLDEGRVVVLVEGWEDPWGEGVFYELNFSKNDDGETIVEEPHELEVSVDLSRKSLAKRARWLGSALAKRLPGTVPEVTKTGKAGDKVEDPERGKAEDPSPRTGSEDDDDEDAADADLVASLDLAEVELSTT